MNAILNARRIICKACPHKCEVYLSKELDITDPNAKCPVKWKSQWFPIPSEISDNENHDAIQTVISYQIEQGSNAWKALHTAAKEGTISSEWITSIFEPMIPRFSCNCLSGWKTLLISIPFKTDDQFAWSVEIHNAVNAKLNKPIISLEDAKQIWNV